MNGCILWMRACRSKMLTSIACHVIGKRQHTLHRVNAATLHVQLFFDEILIIAKSWGALCAPALAPFLISTNWMHVIFVAIIWIFRALMSWLSWPCGDAGRRQLRSRQSLLLSSFSRRWNCSIIYGVCVKLLYCHYSACFAIAACLLRLRLAAASCIRHWMMKKRIFFTNSAKRDGEKRC